MKELVFRVVTRAIAAASLLLPVFAPAVANATRATFDPSQRCETVLTYEDVVDKVMVGMWAFGYLAKSQGRLTVMNGKELQKMLLVLEKFCKEQPTARFSAIVQSMSESRYVAKRSESSVDGRRLLMKFFENGADHAALTAALRPSPEDVRTVYSEPLATALIAGYDKLFQSGAAIRPKPDQVDLLTVFTTTGKLKAGAPVLREFPGGYKQVRDRFLVDVPIARFKFVKSGESLGMAYDGLIFVNGRWVFMPKPWRGLE